MPNLVQSLQTRDLGHLRIVAGMWGVELGSAEDEAALKELTSALLDPNLLGEMVDSLSAEAQSGKPAPAGGTGNRSTSSPSPPPKRFSTGPSWHAPFLIRPAARRNLPISRKIWQN